MQNPERAPMSAQLGVEIGSGCRDATGLALLTLAQELWIVKHRRMLPAGSFDLVSSFIILHEVPADVNAALFLEAFRLFEPGGAVIMTDIPPYATLTKMQAWRYDRAALGGGEPYWREAGLVDTAQLARDAGFVNVRAFKEPSGHYWVTIGEKPG